MPSGYEQSPDYGGPEPTVRGVVLGILAFIAVVIVIVLLVADWL
ncbi:MAG: hypothetical protein WD688_25765 [Candidatus Binatia bacterium]